MYDKSSDYALNKRSRDSIVCKSVTGEHIHIRRADFSSNEEFERWKEWSDDDYHASEKRDRAYSDCKYLLSSNMEPALESSESQFFAALKRSKDAAEVRRIRRCLTSRQFTRLYKRFGLGMSVTSIATEEGVSKSAVMASLRSALDVLRKVICEENSTDC